MDAKPNIIFRAILMLILASSIAFGRDAVQEPKSFEEHIRETVPARKEIDVFLNEMSWAQFDRDIGYVLGKAKEFVRANGKKLMVIITPLEITFLPTR